MSPPSRAEHREDVTAAVLRIGRRHLAERGAAALSLRAVARELGMVSSAVYRYVDSRDELLTLLLVDAYTEQADAVTAAVEAVRGRPWDERLLAAATAFRSWAVDEPARYALLYGSPVPGYAAPPERTIEPGTRVVTALLRLVAEGVAAGDIVDDAAYVVAPDALVEDLTRVGADLDLAAGPAVLGRAVALWAVLVGATSLEVFGQYGADTFTEPAALFEHQLGLALATLRAATP